MNPVLRQLAKSPGFTAVAVFMLALGIGVSSSSFTMTNAFLLRQLPYPDAGRLVRISCTTPQSQQPHGFAPGNLFDVREFATSFAGLAMYNPEAYSLGDVGQPPEKVTVLMASSAFFNVLGVQPQLGRGFLPDDDRAGRTVAIVTHRTWLTRYGGDPAIVGRTIRLNAQPYTVIGVLPETFDAAIVWGDPEFIVPRTLYTGIRTQRTGSWLQGIARLAPGATLRSAQNELNALARQLAHNYPKENVGLGLRVAGLNNANIDDASRSMLWLMTALAVTMLIIACANLAGLQVARAFGRSREFAVRAALGGSRWQLMGPLLLESLVLAGFGGCGGLLLTLWINDLVGRSLVINNTDGYALPMDGHVFAFAIGISVASGLAFGLAPAWFSARASAADVLRESSRSATSSRGQQRLKGTLIVAELALAFALVGVAASFSIGVSAWFHRQLGWEVDGLFVGYVAIPSSHSTPEHDRQFSRDLLVALAAVPGIERAALSTRLPDFSFGDPVAVAVEGRAADEPGREPFAEQNYVSPDFFAALRIPLKKGTLFAPNLTEKDPPVAIVNEAFANQFWPGADPIGRRVRLDGKLKWCQIIGVVGDLQSPGRLNSPETRLQVYRPLVQGEHRYFSITLRSALAPAVLDKQMRADVASLDPDMWVASPGSLRAFIDHVYSNFDIVRVNLAISASMGLLIAVVGVFGVISQFTNQRTRDIGVRIALGAGRGDITRLILGEGGRLLGLGLALGVVGDYALNTVLRHAMSAVPFPGLPVLAATFGLLSAAMLLACWIPARRAARLDPVAALRAE